MHGVDCGTLPDPSQKELLVCPSEGVGFPSIESLQCVPSRLSARTPLSYSVSLPDCGGYVMILCSEYRNAAAICSPVSAAHPVRIHGPLCHMVILPDCNGLIYAALFTLWRCFRWRNVVLPPCCSLLWSICSRPWYRRYTIHMAVA